ncbi:class I SAM-dependent methyltransferase [Clostridium sp. KNHs205]|jgi:ubiquinone/menaquinone biosynthesis C-methylase UbiE|uniref:class I SAM-dependent methyltransferase n=1 Tax=Clostridium sp. KNHs205 TaxID=1449050 RepID=UPI00051C8339|nr:class I SAM-dependent methyltransferase [Clostridium sp. KNHs205]
MTIIETGWERNKRLHFNDIVENYDKMRPEYPQEIFEDVINYSNALTGKGAIEIGAGTGKATHPFLDAGYDVTAIEIGSNMADFLLKRFSGHKGFNVVVSSFEDAVLQESSFDLIYSATAFHWIDAEIGCQKAFRLLKDGGTIALFRYNAIAANGDELYDEIQAIYEKHYYSYYTSDTRPIKKTKEDFEKPSEIYNSFRFEDLRTYGFKDVSMKFYDGYKTFNADEYITWLETMSDHRGLPDSNRKILYAGIKEAIIEHGNHHKIDFIFQLYMGRK